MFPGSLLSVGRCTHTGVINALARNQTADQPMLVFFALVCPGSVTVCHRVVVHSVTNLFPSLPRSATMCATATLAWAA